MALSSTEWGWCVIIGWLVCLRKLLASVAEGAFEDIIIAAPTDSNNTQNHTPNHILQMDIHFNPIIKHYRIFIYLPNQCMKPSRVQMEMKGEP